MVTTPQTSWLRSVGNIWCTMGLVGWRPDDSRIFPCLVFLEVLQKENGRIGPLVPHISRHATVSRDRILAGVLEPVSSLGQNDVSFLQRSNDSLGLCRASPFDGVCYDPDRIVGFQCVAQWFRVESVPVLLGHMFRGVVVQAGR